jgi:hypothetical protein
VPYLVERQDEHILKPNLAYDGHGIVAGWTVDRETWRELLRTRADGSHIVQRRVRPVPERFADPARPGGFGSAYLNWGLFVGADAHRGGGYVKGSEDADTGVISVARGARFGCVFHQVQ